MLQLLLVILLLIATPAQAFIGEIREEDGSPSSYPYALKVTNGSLTDNGDGTVSISTSGGGESTTVGDTAEIDLTLTGTTITGALIAGSIDETKLDVSTNASLDLADSALQAEVDGSTTNELQNIFQTVSTTSGTAPVADTTTDTLTLTAGTGITVTGDSSTDTVTIASTITDTNTNASTICAGTTTYLDGEGNCDDISSVYAPALGADDNYVTDAEKVVIGNTSGTNTGDQTTITGNAGTATALAANGANCSAGQYPLGVDASGAVESCTAVPASSGWTDNGATVNATTAGDNFIIGSTSATAGTSGAGVLGLVIGTAPSTSTTNMVQLYAEDVTGSGSGGTITTSGGKTIHTFTSSGTFVPPSSGNVEILLIAGGGGGGASSGGTPGGGGGAGGYVYSASTAVTVQNYSIVVGAGGAGGVGNFGTNGSDSTGISLTATGGGGGGRYLSDSNKGQAGGSGGGGSYGSAVGGTGSQGYGGGTSGSGNEGGGGGGIGAVGAVGVTSSNGGNGGAGTAYSISGSSVTYGGGGGGGARSSYTNGTGGSGGGGRGGGTSGACATGTVNTGGGGGGAGDSGNGCAGGSGIVIISYTTPSGSAELKVRDEAGNATTLSPHNFKNVPKVRKDEIDAESDGLAWTYHSSNSGKEITVDMFSAIRAIEKITGDQLIFSNADIVRPDGEVAIIDDIKKLKTKKGK